MPINLNRVVKADVSATSLETIYTVPAGATAIVTSMKLVHQDTPDRFTDTPNAATGRNFLPGWRQQNDLASQVHSLQIDATRTLIIAYDMFRGGGSAVLYAQIIERDATTGVYTNGPQLFLSAGVSTVAIATVSSVLMSANKVTVALWNAQLVYSLAISGLKVSLIGSLSQRCRIAPISSTKVLAGFYTGSDFTVRALSVPDSGNPSLVGTAQVMFTGWGSTIPYLVKAQKDSLRYAACNWGTGTTINGGYFSFVDATNTASAGVSGIITAGATINDEFSVGLGSFSEGSDFNAVFYAVAGATPGLQAFTGTNFASFAHASTSQTLTSSGHLNSAMNVLSCGDRVAFVSGQQALVRVAKSGTTVSLSTPRVETGSSFPSILVFNNRVTVTFSGNGQSFNYEWTPDGTTWAASPGTTHVHVPFATPVGRLSKWNPIYNCWVVVTAGGRGLAYLDTTGVLIGWERPANSPSYPVITAMDVLPNGNILCAMANQGTQTAISGVSSIIEVFTPTIRAQGTTTSSLRSSLTQNWGGASSMSSGYTWDVVALTDVLFFFVGIGFNGSNTGVMTGFASLTAFSSTTNTTDSGGSSGRRPELFACWRVSDTTANVTFYSFNGSHFILQRGSHASTGSFTNVRNLYTNAAAITATMPSYVVEVVRSGLNSVYFATNDVLRIQRDGTLSPVVDETITESSTATFDATFGDIHVGVTWTGSNGTFARLYDLSNNAIDYSQTSATTGSAPVVAPRMAVDVGLWDIFAAGIDRLVDWPGSTAITADVVITNAGTDHIIARQYPIAVGGIAENATKEIINSGQSVKVRSSRRWQLTTHLNIIERT